MALEAEGFDVRCYADGAEALKGLNGQPVDVAVLDINMPRMDGMELLAQLRRQNPIPVIFLTSKDDEVDDLLGLRAGDDIQGEPAIVRGQLILDPGRHLCTWRGGQVELTVTEFLILKSLAQRPGHVKNRDQLMDAAYGEHIYVDDRTIDSHIKRLRKKFKSVDDDFAQIETLYGVGYRYREH